jgi:hypothetical protein
MPRAQRRAKAPVAPPPEDDDDEVDDANDAGRRTAASLGLADDDDEDDDEGGEGGGGGGGGGVGGGEEDEDEEEDPDASVLRILLSTDNHLGYLERDPIRGRDSFAAFEEVLSLARTHGVDMVLLSGDLFHENKPSRKTLHAVSSRVALNRSVISPAPRGERISGSGDDDVELCDYGERATPRRPFRIRHRPPPPPHTHTHTASLYFRCSESRPPKNANDAHVHIFIPWNHIAELQLRTNNATNQRSIKPKRKRNEPNDMVDHGNPATVLHGGGTRRLSDS